MRIVPILTCPPFSAARLAPGAETCCEGTLRNYAGPLTKERSAMNAGAVRVALLTLLTSTIALAGCGTVPAPSATAPKAPARSATASTPAGQGKVGQLGWAAWR